MQEKQIKKFNDILQGVSLTADEERTLLWLAGWEETTIDNILSLMEKVARKRANENH